ncbi:MAG: tetratricopeptide repeat protein, partial [Pyrinomonadaceae bacterium]
MTLKQADGTTALVKDAVVIFYRTDITGRYQTKTDKSGRYVYAGLPFTGVFTIVVSAPGARPDFISNMRISQQPENNFVLEVGDGSSLTMDQIKTAQASLPPSTGNDAAPTSAAAKKDADEMAKRRAANEEARKKAETDFAKLNDVLKAGNQAFSSKNYDEAIRNYDQGIEIDPNQAVFYRNKGLALRARAVDKFNTASSTKDAAGKDAARADLKAAAEAAEKSIAVARDDPSKNTGVGGANTGTDAAKEKELDLGLMSDRAETYRLALATNTPDIADPAVKAVQEYLNAETDPAKKTKAQVGLGNAQFQAGKVDEAVATYQQVLSANPENYDAMYGLGIALAADPNGTKVKEARDMLKQFVAKAPAIDARKQDATDAIAGLEETLKAAGAKPTDEAGGGKK